VPRKKKSEDDVILGAIQCLGYFHFPIPQAGYPSEARLFIDVVREWLHERKDPRLLQEGPFTLIHHLDMRAACAEYVRYRMMLEEFQYEDAAHHA
jgi:hypothetical protein